MRLIYSAVIALVFCGTAMAGNVANCEIAVSKPVLLEGQKTGAHIQTYMLASDYIGSVYDDQDGHLTEIDQGKILALYCTRQDVIATLRDFPLMATGIPMALSTDFETKGTPLIYYFYADGAFRHVYEGPDMQPKQSARLTDAMEIFNLQPHDLKP